MDCSQPSYSVSEVSQTRMLERVVISSPGDIPDPETEPASPPLGATFFTTEQPGEPNMLSLHLSISL